MPSIKDVAKKSGYSISTVSKALNGYKDVSQKAKEKIIKIAEEMNYVPDLALKNLTKKENSIIAVIFSGLRKDGAADGITYNIMSGVYEYTCKKNYDLIVYTTNASKQNETSYYRFCKERNIDGAIVHGISTDDPYFRELISSELPCVIIDIYTDNEKVGFVSIDNVKASMEATEYLIGTGHKNIAMVNGNPNAVVTKLREEGFKSALEKNNIDNSHIVYGDYSRKKAYNEAFKLLQLQPEITAIFCASDLMALGVYEAAKKLELSIPDDLSVIGFDNIPLASFVSPPLTTIKQDMHRIGYEAAKLLKSIIRNEKIKISKLLDYDLIIRDSTKAIKK